MEMIRHVYEDPTGGGEDITLTVPEWATPPDVVSVRDRDGVRMDFDYSDEMSGEEDDDE